MNGFKTDEEKQKNIDLGNASRRGKPLSKEHKQKMSESLKGTIFTEERKNNISNALKGIIRSQENKDKIAITLSGRPDYIEVRQKIIEMYNTGNYTRKELAQMFNMKPDQIKAIMRKYRMDQKIVKSS